MLEETGCCSDIICELGIIEENSLKYNWSGISSCFLAKSKGEKGIPRLTQEELDEETQLQWHDLHKALGIIINQNNNESYFARNERENAIMKFITARDISMLDEVVKLNK